MTRVVVKYQVVLLTIGGEQQGLGLSMTIPQAVCFDGCYYSPLLTYCEERVLPQEIVSTTFANFNKGLFTF